MDSAKTGGYSELVETFLNSKTTQLQNRVLDGVELRKLFCQKRGKGSYHILLLIKYSLLLIDSVTISFKSNSSLSFFIA